MTYTYPETWELAKGNINAVSKAIEFYKPVTKSSLQYKGTCDDCLKQKPHSPHTKPSSLSDNFARLVKTQTAITGLKNEVENLEEQQAGTANLNQEYFAEAELPLKEKLKTLEEQQTSSDTHATDLKTRLREGSISTNEVLAIEKPLFLGQERRSNTINTTVREHEAMRKKWEEFQRANNEIFDAQIEKLKLKININWFRDQKWDWVKGRKSEDDLVLTLQVSSSA